jgi:hypothetical protein
MSAPLAKARFGMIWNVVFERKSTKTSPVSAQRRKLVQASRPPPLALFQLSASESKDMS